MCAGVLGYVMPALADVAEADGRISLTLDGGRLPLMAPATGELKGTLVIHSAALGPGAVSREIGLLLKQEAPACRVRGCKVPFQLVNGRVHHRDLALNFPDVTVKTSGSVGLDGSLALVAEMPIPARLVGASKLSAALAKQTIRVPITGTVDHPRVDQTALRAIMAQLTRDAAGDALRQEVEGQLQRLLRPRGGN
jgi:translocation and assembly module TamB